MENALKQAVQQAIQEKKIERVQYYSAINEFLTVTAIIKKMEEKEGETVIELATGEEIPFGQLVRVGQVAASQYDDGFFQCGL